MSQARSDARRAERRMEKLSLDRLGTGCFALMRPYGRAKVSWESWIPKIPQGLKPVELHKVTYSRWIIPEAVFFAIR